MGNLFLQFRYLTMTSHEHQCVVNHQQHTYLFSKVFKRTERKRLISTLVAVSENISHVEDPIILRACPSVSWLHLGDDISMVYWRFIDSTDALRLYGSWPTTVVWVSIKNVNIFFEDTVCLGGLVCLAPTVVIESLIVMISVIVKDIWWLVKLACNSNFGENPSLVPHIGNCNANLKNYKGLT